MSTSEWFAAILILLVIGYLVLDHMMLGKGFDVTRRLKYFFISLFLLPLGCFFIWMSIHNIENAIDLANNGVEVAAVVKESKVEKKYRRKRMHTYYKNTVTFDGNERTFNLDQAYEQGTKFYLVYSTKNPENARITRLKDSTLSYFLHNKSIWNFIVLIGGPIFCFVVGIKSLILLFKKEITLDIAEIE